MWVSISFSPDSQMLAVGSKGFSDGKNYEGIKILSISK
jgi:hypothetical protein